MWLHVSNFVYSCYSFILECVMIRERVDVLNFRTILHLLIITQKGNEIPPESFRVIHKHSHQIVIIF